MDIVKAKSELKKIALKMAEARDFKKLSRNKRWRKNPLWRYRNEIKTLREAGGSWNKISIWLANEKNLKRDPTTIYRFIESLENKENG
jgi:hypothetical protein